MKDIMVYVVFECDCCEDIICAEAPTKGQARAIACEHENPIMYHMIQGRYVEKL